jgi:hypothetical protein
MKNLVILIVVLVFAQGCMKPLPTPEELAEAQRQSELAEAEQVAPELIPAAGMAQSANIEAEEFTHRLAVVNDSLKLDAYDDGNFSKANLHYNMKPVLDAIANRCGRYNRFNMSMKIKCMEFQNDAWVELGRFTRPFRSSDKTQNLAVVGSCIEKHADTLPWGVDFVSALSCSRGEIYSRAKLGTDKVEVISKIDRNSREIGRKIRVFCERKWGDNYRMVEHCGERQIEATQSIKAFLKNQSIPRKIRDGIFARCAKKWSGKNFETLNNVMTSHCIETQYGSYKRLN